MAGFVWKIDRPQKGLAVLALEGEMSLGAREAMREAFESLVGAGERRSVVDFTRVRLVSSGAIGELVRCQSKLSAAGRTLLMVCPPGDVLETLMVADMHRLIPHHTELSSISKGLDS